MTETPPFEFDYDGYPDDLRELLLTLAYELAHLFHRLELGKIIISKWESEMVKLLSGYTVAAFMEGANRTKLTLPDKNRLAQQVAKQRGFLQRFREEMDRATEFQADKWRRRAVSYARALVAPYWEGSTGGLPLPAMPGDLTSQCKQGCHCHWGIITLDKKAGDYDCYWVLGDAKHCQTCEVRAEEWNPLLIRGGYIVLDTIPVTEDVLMGIGTQPSTQINVTANKHLQGRHDQKRHGWRYSGGMQPVERVVSMDRMFGSVAGIRAEADEYRVRWSRGGPNLGLAEKMLADKIKAKWPLSSADDIKNYTDVMNLSEERFRHYADSLGISYDEAFVEFYHRQKLANKRIAYIKQQAEKKHLAFEGIDMVRESESLRQATEHLRGASAQDAVRELASMGISVTIKDGVDAQDAHEQLSGLLNVIDALPIIKDAVAKRYFTGVTLDSAAPYAGQATGKTLTIKGMIINNEGEHLWGGACHASLWIHEIGHLIEGAVDPVSLSGVMNNFNNTGNDRRTVSQYGNRTGLEDWAEWFTAIVGGNYDLKKLRAWNPKKFDYMMRVVPGLKEFTRGNPL